MSATTPNKARKPSKRPDPKQQVTSEILDRAPPSRVEAEQAVLGSMLIHPDCCDDVALVLESSDFYDDANATIYSHLRRLRDKGRPIDIQLLVESLQSASELETAGGLEHLAKVAGSVPNAAHAVAYAEVVREASLRRSIINVSTESLRDAYDDTVQAGELMGRTEQAVFAIAERMIAAPQSMADVFAAAMEAIDGRRNSGGVSGVKTGLGALDGALNGLQDQELIVLAGRPSMGKSALAINIATNASVRNEVPTLIISLEMSAQSMAERMLSSLGRVDGEKMRSGRLSQDDYQSLIAAQDRIYSAPLWIDDSATLTVSQIASLARRHKRKHNLGLLVVDYLGYVQPSSTLVQRQEQVAEISRGLKAIAKSVGIPVLVVAQLNRKAEDSKDNRPKLSHLRESGAIEQDADVVMFVHRPEYYLTGPEKEAAAGKAEIIIAKNRNGPIADVDVLWSKATTTFYSKAEDRHESEEPRVQRISEFDEFNRQGSMGYF